MKRLTVIRHAKSSWDDGSLGDFDRPLNPRGWKAARGIGRELKEKKIHFDICVASPAARVRETLDGLGEGYGQFRFHVRFESAIYEASAATLLNLIQRLPESVTDALLVGHNPGLQRLIVELTRKGKLHEQVALKFPTAAVAVAEFAGPGWSDVQAGSGTLVDLILPKELKDD